MTVLMKTDFHSSYFLPSRKNVDNTVVENKDNFLIGFKV